MESNCEVAEDTTAGTHEGEAVLDIVQLNGESVAVNLCGLTLIRDVKKELEKMLGIPIKAQRLLVNHGELFNESNLPDQPYPVITLLAQPLSEMQSLELDLRNHMVFDSSFYFPKRYTYLDVLGYANGLVCSFYDDQHDESVAIRKMEGASGMFTSAIRTLRELRILRHLQHENVIDVKSVFFSGNKDTVEDIYVVSSFMDTACLASILKSSQQLTDDHCQLFLYQILRGINFVHSAEVIHRNLKPRNLLVNTNCDLKISDFGLASTPFTLIDAHDSSVSNRWYTAPEAFCRSSGETSAVDMWSIGCIFAEMLARRPLFPGHSAMQQLELIVGHLGQPGAEALLKIPNEKCRRFVESLPRSKIRPLQKVFEHAPANTLDLMLAMLQFDPEKRIQATSALGHPYCGQLSCPEDEPTTTPIEMHAFEYERRRITTKVLREELFLEALHYHPDEWKQYVYSKKFQDSSHNIENYPLLHERDMCMSDDSD